MKVISNGNVIDFDKVVKLSYRECVLGNGYLIEIITDGESFFNNVLEIARVSTASYAYRLVCAITESWAENASIFDVNDWIEKNPCVFVPSVKENS